MIKESYKLPKGKFLGQIEPFKTEGLPNKSIVHKKIPGCGATTLELEFPRDSIVVEPNKPVIIGKCNKYNGKKRKHKVILGVYEGIEVSDIKRYIENRKGFKKILTTPEGFTKIKEALGDEMYKKYFILFDECEKAIQDIDFRKDVINPIDDFFKFDLKAFVSATPIIPTDPRFADFKLVTIEPDYDFSEDICVLTTNNVAYQLKILLDALESSKQLYNRKCFIFIKSTGRMERLINRLGVQKDTSVFCSEKSAKELRLNGIENVYSAINDKFTKLNFLTNRFFSAVDIDYKMYKCNPIIIMLSDVIAVAHTVIDPSTESIQICGRFRKPEGGDILLNGGTEIVVHKDIYHISNYSSKLTNFTKEEIDAILYDKKRLHDFVTKFNPRSDMVYMNAFIEEILELNGFNTFLKYSGKLNHFMVDNFIYKERVKGYYQTSSSLITQYRNTEHFIVTESSQFYHYELTDEQMDEISAKTKSVTVEEFVSTRVKYLMEKYKDNDFGQVINLSTLRFSYPNQMSVIDNYGLKNAKELDYSIFRIKQQQEEAKGLKKLLPILAFIKREFVVGVGYTSDEIEAILTRGIAETGLNDLKPNVQLLREAAQLSERKNVKKDESGNWVKGYEILWFRHEF